MTRINGWVYTIIGAAVSIYSYVVNPEKLRLFIWVGIAAVVFGLIRVVIDNMNNPTTKPVHHKHHNNTRQPIAKNFCSSCGTAVHDFQNFCHNCGQRFMHRK